MMTGAMSSSGPCPPGSLPWASPPVLGRTRMQGARPAPLGWVFLVLSWFFRLLFFIFLGRSPVGTPDFLWLHAVLRVLAFL